MIEWDGWACPEINCTDIDKNGRGVIKYKKLSKRQKKAQQKSESRFVKAFFIYTAIWFAAMFYFAIFDRHSDLGSCVIFIGMLGWMYVPIMFAL